MKHERIKSLMTAAAEAVLRGDSDAVEQTELALAELKRSRLPMKPSVKAAKGEPRDPV